MKRSVINSLESAVAVVLLLFASFSVHIVQAQSENIKESQSVSISTTEDGKVKLKVIQKKGNDETTFEKTYDSHEDMKNDPDLEKYGIGQNSLRFDFGSTQPKFFFHNGPGQGFWDDEDFDMSPFMDMQERMREMMKGFGGNFDFDFGANSFMDIDSLTKRFNFRNDNGKFFMNGEEITDLDSLREAMRDRLGQFQFDFGNWDKDDIPGFWSFNLDQDGDNGDVRVITRAKVMIKSASDDDKKSIGTDKMEGLELRDISFYPNPSDGRFDVDLETKSDSPVQIIIVDSNGNEVFNRVGSPSDGAYQFHVDLTHEGKGIYIMKLVQNDKALTKRVVIE